MRKNVSVCYVSNLVHVSPGDNILALLKHLVTTKTLADPSEYRHGSMVFFDVLGVAMVAYPARVGSIINYMVAIATLIYLAKKCLRPSNVGRYTHTQTHTVG